MEISKAFHISTDYKDRRPPHWESLQFAEVLFIDKTHSANRPMVYQLRDNKINIEQILDFYKLNGFSASKDDFILLGEVNFIDKQKKQISLIDNNVVAYHHLVIASGHKQLLSFHNHELGAALQALTHALRVKTKIPDSFPSYRKKHSALNPRKKEITFAKSDKSIESPEELNIERIVQPYILDIKPKHRSSNLHSHHSRFYEVQT